MLALLYKLDELVASLEKLLMTIMCGALAVLLVAQATLRYVFSSPLFWAEEIAVFFLLGVTFFGMSYLLHKRQLISIDFVVLHLKASVRHLIDLLTALMGMVLLAILAWLCFEWVARPEVRLEISATTGLPRYLNYGFLLVALVLMLFHQVVALSKCLETLFGGPK